MATAISMQCSLRCIQYRTGAGRRSKAHRIRARLAAFAVAAIALVLIVYGEHWLLRQAPATTVLAAAAYAIDALSGGAAAWESNVNDTNPDGNGIAR